MIRRLSLVVLCAALAACSGNTDVRALDPSALAGAYRVSLSPDAQSSFTCGDLAVTIAGGATRWNGAGCLANPAPGAIIGDTLVLNAWEPIYATGDSISVTRYRFAAFTGSADDARSRWLGPCHDIGSGLCLHETGDASWVR
jgi:hypothetical protein